MWTWIGWTVAALSFGGVVAIVCYLAFSNGSSHTKPTVKETGNMTLREMITKRLEEQGYTDVTISNGYFGKGHGDPIFYKVTLTSPTGRELIGQAYNHLDMGPGEKYSIFLPEIDKDDPDEEWEGEPRIYMVL